MVTRRIPDPKIGGSVPSGVKFFGFLAQFGRAFDFKSIGRRFDPTHVTFVFQKNCMSCRFGWCSWLSRQSNTLEVASSILAPNTFVLHDTVVNSDLFCGNVLQDPGWRNR